MSTTIDYEQVKGELVVFLRNSNIYTISQRGVTTQTDTSTFAVPTATLTIARPNVKNVRTMKIGSTYLSFGLDYIVNYDNSGSCLITFTTPQTGVWEVIYDYGTDKIYPDLPREDLTISSYPRIGIDIIGDDSVDIELGAMTKMTNLSFSLYIYDFKVSDIDNTLTKIKKAMMANQKLFYYQRYVKRLRTGPLMIFQTYGQSRVMFKTIDYLSEFNLEYV
jgi:hypothetical protein